MQIPEVLNTVIHGDCLEVMKTMPSESIDLIVTSPPYNIRNNLGGGFKTPGKRWQAPGLSDGYDGYSDNMPYTDYIAWQKQCIAEMFRLLKPNGAIFYNNKNRIQGGGNRGQKYNRKGLSAASSDCLETCWRSKFQ